MARDHKKEYARRKIVNSMRLDMTDEELKFWCLRILNG